MLTKIIAFHEVDVEVIDLTMEKSEFNWQHHFPTSDSHVKSVGVFNMLDFENPSKAFRSSRVIDRKKTSVAKCIKKRSTKAKRYEKRPRATMVQTKMFGFIHYGVIVDKI